MNKSPSGHSGRIENHAHEKHEHSLWQELICHLPYATFSVAIAFIVLSLVHFMSIGFTAYPEEMREGYHLLFHSFHYLHIIFASVGTFVAFSRFSNNVLRGAIISLIFPVIFCTLSDIALPALAGNVLGIAMDVHICFFSLQDTMNVAPFIIVGIFTGVAMSRHYASMLHFISLSSHFVHILISSLAATFYTASFGFTAWASCMGLLFLLLVLAVVIPCTISDVVVPMYFAHRRHG